MECDICREDFDQAERTPKNVPCGHTVCLRCLQRNQKKECPTCRKAFTSSPTDLPTSLIALRTIGRLRDARVPRGWCPDCRTAATPRCWDDHDVLATKAALRRHLRADVLQQAAGQLPGLRDQCQELEVLLTLLTAESWDLTLRDGSNVLTGTVRNAGEPLVKAVWLVLAAKAALAKQQVAVNTVSIKQEAEPHPQTNDDEDTLLVENVHFSPAAREQEERGASPPPATANPCRAAAVAATPPRPAGRPPRAAASPHHSARKQPPAGGLPDLARELDVRGRDTTSPTAKEAVLRDAPGVARLFGVDCDEDPAWSLQLLLHAAPTLEHLSVNYPRAEHLHALQGMPLLRRLEVQCPDSALDKDPPLFSQQCELGHRGLQWLNVWNLPRVTLQTLLRAHGRSLETLELYVGTAGEDDWPWSCGDLHVLLLRSDLRALKRLVLRRWHCSHELADCNRQRSAARRVLAAAVEVLCELCDKVWNEGV
ncbi:uncharacterized protein LOC127751934 [Frankliniella occidentalis]|uniref:Uncharacterized protein LOC127751934 n=1 Tax=Frankliniella occidentalis TaxID=133901 RepID=A0A9C6XAV5_FRAOC|nr:uncharacterized protein LOC127751934 [Frankliniella occidentalis]